MSSTMLIALPFHSAATTHGPADRHHCTPRRCRGLGQVTDHRIHRTKVHRIAVNLAQSGLRGWLSSAKRTHGVGIELPGHWRPVPSLESLNGPAGAWAGSTICFQQPIAQDCKRLLFLADFLLWKERQASGGRRSRVAILSHLELVLEPDRRRVESA
jgi:hypothetical protein